MKDSNKTITRKQLCSLGISQYQAKILTKSLSTVRREGRAYVYSVRDVIASIREYAERPRVLAKTRDRLEKVIEALRPMLGNVTTIAPGHSTDPEMSKLVKQLMSAMAKTDATLASMKVESAEIEAEYSNGQA